MALGVGLLRLLLVRGLGLRGGLLLVGCFELALIDFQDLCAALVEALPAAELGQCLVGLALVLLALLAEMIDHLGCQRFGAFDSDIRESGADTRGAECGIPLGTDRGCGDVELVA